LCEYYTGLYRESVAFVLQRGEHHVISGDSEYSTQSVERAVEKDVTERRTGLKNGTFYKSHKKCAGESRGGSAKKCNNFNVMV
jgi:hypothetical protein